MKVHDEPFALPLQSSAIDLRLDRKDVAQLHVELVNLPDARPAGLRKIWNLLQAVGKPAPVTVEPLNILHDESMIGDCPAPLRDGVCSSLKLHGIGNRRS
jgi:hypothetical protein